MEKNQQIDVNMIETGLKLALNFLVKEDKFPNFQSSYIYKGRGPGGQKCFEYRFQCFDKRGNVEYHFQRLYFFEYSLPENALKNDNIGMVNTLEARPMNHLEVIDYNEWNRDNADLITELQLKYPATLDIPGIIEKEILNKQLKN